MSQKERRRQMSGKRFKALVIAVLLALTASLISPLPAAPTIVLAEECSSTASGCP
jgi:hypothetical protein